MAFVDGSKKLLATSSELFDHVCGPCKTGGNIKEAKQYCGDCSEYLCDLCVEYHPKIPVLKNHNIIGTNEVSVGTDSRLAVKCGCNKNREVEYYCDDHNKVICSLCKYIKHHDCQTTTIQHRSCGYTRANLESIISRTKSLKVKYERFIQDCNGNVEELKRSTETCKKEIKAFRVELDQFLDKLEQSMLAELEQCESKEQQRIDRQIITLTSALQMLEVDCQMLSDAKNDGRKHVMFAADIQTSKSLQNCERRSADLEREMGKLSISFEKNETLSDLRSYITNLGTLKVSEETYKQKSNIMLLGQQITSHRKVSDRLADEKETTCITGSVVMNKDYTLICDFNNCKLKLLDNTLAITNHYVFSDSPWDISVFDTNNVIATIPHKNQLQVVQVFPKLEVSRSIQLDKKCWGVEVVGGSIYVSCHNNPGDGEVRVLDKNGKLEQRLGINKDGSFMFSRPSYIALSRTGNKIFVSDRNYNSITCMTVDSSILYQYRVLACPRGMYCDVSDNILVCCRESDTVQVITAEGKLYNTLLSSEDGLHCPYSVTYRRNDSILVIGCLGQDHLLVYHLTP